MVPPQHALEAAEAAARVVVDAMEAESAAGSTTPPVAGQPLEAIQLFEQADSQDVRSSPAKSNSALLMAWTFARPAVR